MSMPEIQIVARNMSNITAVFEYAGKRWRADLANLERFKKYAGRLSILQTHPMETMIFEADKNWQSKDSGKPAYTYHHDTFGCETLLGDIAVFIQGLDEQKGAE